MTVLFPSRLSILLLVLLGFALATEAEDQSVTNVTYKIRPNVIHEFAVPLTAAAKVGVATSKNQAVEMAKAAIAVPLGFDPEIPHPILVVVATSDGLASSLSAMPYFTNAALRLGYVVLAADGPYGKPPNDNPAWRWAMLSSLLEHTQKSWPGSRKWPIACAGFSGGGKWAGVIGAILSQKGFNLIGVFQGGVNQDMASQAAKLYDPAARYKKTPIFLSSGSDDPVATPDQHFQVKESLEENGFTNVRLDTYKGGHEMDARELQNALKWFIEEYSKPALDDIPSEFTANPPKKEPELDSTAKD